MPMMMKNILSLCVGNGAGKLIFSRHDPLKWQNVHRLIVLLASPVKARCCQL